MRRETIGSFDRDCMFGAGGRSRGGGEFRGIAIEDTGEEAEFVVLRWDGGKREGITPESSRGLVAAEGEVRVLAWLVLPKSFVILGRWDPDLHDRSIVKKAE